MLSLGKLAPGQQQYYLDTVANGAEEYYTGAKESPGQWVGSAAARLELSGEVNAAALHRILDARHPRTGVRLTRAHGAVTVPGFDATFSAPKSVSLLFALGDPETSNQVRNAHDAAVRAALAVLETEAARARRGKGGKERLTADGFVAAAFRHRTSRAGDPQLHTHVVIANLVHTVTDDRWSALDARPLYAWAKTVGYLYEAQLRAELTRRLGVDWRPITSGIADITGIPDTVLRGFSQRRQQIEAHLAEHGQHGARAAQAATYATRPARDLDVGPEGLMPEWRQRARRLGLNDRVLAATLTRAAPASVPSPGTERAEALFAQLASPDGLTAHDASFGRREVLRALCDALPRGADIEMILELTQAFLASSHAVRLGAPTPVRDNDVIRRQDGIVVAAHVDQARWTTPEMLAIERGLVDAAHRRRHTRVGVAHPATLEAALAARPSLSTEQVRVIRRVTRSGAGVDVVEGAAGSGKTHALGAAREAWQASGYRVFGCALAARTAAQLQTGSGIPSVTVDRLLRYLDDPRGNGLDRDSVIVVDEAATLGTRTLHRLLQHAETADAKLVLIGDHHQLPEIGAGGAFASLTKRLGSTRLHDNRRQHAAWERQALARLRAGSTDRALASYVAHDRVHLHTDPEVARHRLVRDWWQARLTNPDTVMITARRADAEDLNRRARALLTQRGMLGTDELQASGRGFAVGDEVLALRNDYRLGVLNGTRGHVTRLQPNTGHLGVRTREGLDVVIPPAYLQAGHLAHAYATTLYKAQGSTVDRTFVLADELLDQEHAYTGLSRGRQRNDLYLGASDQRADERHLPEITTGPLTRLHQALARSGRKTMAIDQSDCGFHSRQDDPAESPTIGRENSQPHPWPTAATRTPPLETEIALEL